MVNFPLDICIGLVVYFFLSLFPRVFGVDLSQVLLEGLSFGNCILAFAVHSSMVRQQDAQTPIVMMGYANPIERFGYEAFADACAEAGVDGLITVDLPPEEVKAIPTVCGSLREAMESLDKDREFLTQGDVFTDDQIDAYIALKFEEIHKFEHAPHPVEFEMYYSS